MSRRVAMDAPIRNTGLNSALFPSVGERMLLIFIINAHFLIVDISFNHYSLHPSGNLVMCKVDFKYLSFCATLTAVSCNFSNLN